MFEDSSDDARLGDESEDLHLAAASVAEQRVDVVDAVDELGPSFVGGASRRSRLGFVVGTNVFSEVLSDAIGIDAVEMDQVFVGLGDVDENACEKLEGVVQGVIVELVSWLGLVDEQARARVESQPGKVNRSPHEITRQLVQAFGVGGIDRGAVVDGEAGVSPRHEQVDAVLRDQPPVLEQSEYLVSKEELGSVLVDVRNGYPLTVGSPDPSGSDGVDVGIPF